MTDDEIIQLLKEIDMCTHAYSNGMHIATTYDITKMRLFAKRAAAAEREACAKICDGWASYGVPAVAAAAQAIRARNTQEQPR